MDGRSQDGGSRQLQGDQMAGPVVRARWCPKPEQVSFLETVFDSGIINPSKGETVQIRQHLEKFGAVDDVNIFYWFQNHRHRSRKRQRQIEASLGEAEAQAPRCTQASLGEAEAQAPRCTHCGARIINPDDNFIPSSLSYPVNMGQWVTGSTSSTGPDHAQYSGEFLSLLGQPGLQVEQYEQNPLFCSPDATFPYQSEVITVFINGVAMEVGRGGLDMDIRGMFGGDNFVLFHSSGVPVPVNDNGFLVQGLDHGENYFLVSNQVPKLS